MDLIAPSTGGTCVGKRMCFAAIGLVFWQSVACGQESAEQAIENYHRKFVVTTCAKAPASDEIVVCAADNSRYRLPLPTERSPDEHVAGEIPRAPTAADPFRPCGVFAGQRRCGIKELRRYGYGGGSVPMRALVMLAKAAVDPDAEIGPVKGYPVSPREIK